MTFLPWSTRRSALAGGLTLAMLAPLSAAVSATPRSTFSDVSFNHWARPFITVLAQNNILMGYSDGTFRPDMPITKAQFDSILQRTFGSTKGSSLNGDDPISRMQALVALSNKLDLEPEGSVNNTLNAYRDAVEIPSYAHEEIAAATQNSLVVNYPNVLYLNPYRAMTRADAAAFIYQALVQQQQLNPLDADTKTANYIVGQSKSIPESVASPQQPAKVQEPLATNSQIQQMNLLDQGSQIPLEYPGARDVNLLITPGETYATTLAVAEPVINAEGEMLIPEGSSIQGRFVPTKVNGTTPATQFVADSLKVGNRSYNINAASSPRIAVDQTELESTDLKGLITSAAAQGIVDSISGKSSNLGDFLSGTFGVNKPERKSQRVIRIEPDSLTLTTQANLQIVESIKTE